MPSVTGEPVGNDPPRIWFEPMSARSTSRPFGVSKPLTPAVEAAAAFTVAFTPWEAYSFAMRSISDAGMPVISAYSSTVRLPTVSFMHENPERTLTPFTSPSKSNTPRSHASCAAGSLVAASMTT